MSQCQVQASWDEAGRLAREMRARVKAALDAADITPACG
jgi:hypothetical protein